MIVSVLFSIQDRSEERIAMQVLVGSPELLRNAEDILFAEIRRSQPSLAQLGIGFSVSPQTVRMKGGRPKKTPYFACCYNFGNLGNVNIVAFFIR
jgi:hypothetical protein